MQSKDICRIARRSAGMTQERWAEALGVSAEAVSQYERGVIRPADDVILSMATIAALPVVCYWHMQDRSLIASRLLPEVADVPLSQAVIRLLLELKEFRSQGRLDELLRIAEDGTVDDGEAQRFQEIAEELRALIAAAMQVRLSKDAARLAPGEEGAG